MVSLLCEYGDNELNRQNRRKLCHMQRISMASLLCGCEDDELNC